MVYKELGKSLGDMAAKIRTTTTMNVSVAELKKLEAKGEKGVDLKANIKKLATSTNETFKKYTDRLKHMPVELQLALRNHIARFFLMSANRFDKNSVKGLNKEEFGKYHNEMIAKVNLIVNKHAPSKEVIDARMKAAMEVTEQEKKLKEKQLQISLNVKDKFSTAALHDPLRAREELFKMQTQSAKLQNDANDGFKACAALQKTVVRYAKLSSYKQRFYAKGKRLRANIKGLHRKRVLEAKNKIVKKVEKRKAEIEAHGKLINKAPAETKKRLIKLREQTLKQLKATKGNTGERKNNKLYQALEQKQDMIAKRRKALLAMRDEQVSKLEKGHSFTHPQRAAQDVIKDSMKRIDVLMKTPAKQLNMTPKQKKAYIEALKKKKSVLAQSSKKIDKSHKNRKRVAITDYIEGTLDPALNSMHSTMRQLEAQKLQNGNLEDRVTAYFMPKIDAMDQVAKANAGVILDINLTNTKTLHSLKSGIDSTLKLNVSKPGLTKIGMDIATELGKDTFAAHKSKYIGAFTKKVTGQLDSWGNALQSVDIPVLGQISYMVGQSVKTTSGAWEAVGGMVKGITDMDADKVGAIKGMMAFIGRDPKTGNWSFKTHWKARTAAEDAFIGMDKLKKGEYEKAVGVAAVNILTAIVGGGQVAGAKGAAQAGRVGAAAKIAGQAGKVGRLARLRAMGRNMITRSKGAKPGVPHGRPLKPLTKRQARKIDRMVEKEAMKDVNKAAEGLGLNKNISRTDAIYALRKLRTKLANLGYKSEYIDKLINKRFSKIVKRIKKGELTKRQAQKLAKLKSPKTKTPTVEYGTPGRPTRQVKVGANNLMELRQASKGVKIPTATELANMSSKQAYSVFRQLRQNLITKHGHSPRFATKIIEKGQKALYKKAMSKSPTVPRIRAKAPVKQPIKPGAQPKQPQRVPEPGHVSRPVKPGRTPSNPKARMVDARGIDQATGKRVYDMVKMDEATGVTAKFKKMGFKERSPIQVEQPNGYMEGGWKVVKQESNGLIKVVDSTGRRTRTLSKQEIISANRNGPSKVSPATQRVTKIFEEAAGGVKVTGKENAKQAYKAFGDIVERLKKSKHTTRPMSTSEAQALIKHKNPELFRKAQVHKAREAAKARAPKPKPRRVHKDRAPEMIVEDGVNVLTGKKVGRPKPAVSTKPAPAPKPTAKPKSARSQTRHERRLALAEKRASEFTIARKSPHWQIDEYVNSIKQRIKAGKKAIVTFKAGDSAKTTQVLAELKKLQKGPNGKNLTIVEPPKSGLVTKVGRKAVKTDKASGTIGRDTVAKTAARNKRLAAAARKRGHEFRGEGAGSKPATTAEKTFDRLKFKKDQYVIGGGTKGKYDYGWRVREITKEGKTIIQKGRKAKVLTKAQLVTLNPKGGVATMKDAQYLDAVQKVGMTGAEKGAQAQAKYLALKNKLRTQFGITKGVDDLIKSKNPEFMKAVDDHVRKSTTKKRIKA